VPYVLRKTRDKASGNQIIEGSPDVFIDGFAAVRQNDHVSDGSKFIPPLSPTLFINGRPAARVGDRTDAGDIGQSIGSAEVSADE